MAQVSKFQLYQPKDFNSLTDNNHWGAMYANDPYMASTIVENLYALNVGDDPLTFMNRFPVKEIPGDRPVQWMLQGQDQKKISLIRALDASGNTLASTATPGKNKSRFFMEFAEAYFSITHVIVGMKVDYYKLLICDHPQQSGTHFIYEVELITDNVNEFVPMEELAAGTEWSIIYSASEQRGSKVGSGVNFTSPFKMEVEMGFMRKEYQVFGEDIDKGENHPLAFSFRDSSGAIQTRWIKKLDWEFLKGFRREFANMLMYGKSNKLSNGTYYNKGVTGSQMRTGTGLREQIAPANIMTYNTFNLDVFTDFLLSLSVNKLPEDSREFVLMTGTYGAIEFSKAVEREAKSFDSNNLSFNTGKRFTGGIQDMTYSRGEFSGYVTFRGIKVKLLVIPQYDDQILHKTPMPGKSGMAESYRYTILDFGTSSGEPNIQRLVPKGGNEIYKYVPGLRDPFSPNSGTNPGMIASKVDGYEIIRAITGGIMVKNPMRMGEYVPSVIA